MVTNVGFVAENLKVEDDDREWDEQVHADDDEVENLMNRIEDDATDIFFSSL